MNEKVKGKLEIYIGPNGYGKTYRLSEIINNLKKDGIGEKEIFFLKSEILLLDEIKDTKDNSQTMEYLISELLDTLEIEEKKKELEREIDKVICSNKEKLNSFIEEASKMTEQKRTSDFITSKSLDSLSKFLSISKIDFKNLGSGQRMFVLLQMVKNSIKNYIFIDEPERFAHPTLQHKIADILNQLVKEGKKVYIASHSPKLISMLNFEFQNLFVINDSSHKPKQINFEKSISTSIKTLPIDNFNNKNKSYYNIDNLKNNILNIHRREFINVLFTKKVFLIEGINDSIYLNFLLKLSNNIYQEYELFHTYGKNSIPIFYEIFKSLNIEIFSIFDRDNDKSSIHNIVNTQLRRISNYIEFEKNLEQNLTYNGEKFNSMDFIQHLENLDDNFKTQFINNHIEKIIFFFNN